MPEEDLETAELKEKIDEDVERAVEEREARASPSWTKYLSLSTAMIAGFAAIASLESGAASHQAIREKSEAMLAQSRASDQWAYFQAKGIKAELASGQAALVGATRPDLAASLNRDVARYREDAEQIEKKAHEMEAQVEESNRRS